MKGNINMSKWEKLTENRYTLNDIFTKNYEKWMLVPLFIYLLTPIVHMIVYAINYSSEAVDDELYHLLATGEMPGDYYTPIIHFSFLLGAFFAIIAYASYKSYVKSHSIKRYPDNLPMLFFLVYLLLILVSTMANKTEFNYIMGFTVRGEGIVSIFCYFLVFYLCGSFIKKENYKYAIMYFFLATGIVIGILTVIDEYVTPVNIITANFFSGIFYHFNFYAYYLTISIMLSAALSLLDKSRARRIFAFITFCFDTVVLAINDSLGGFIACVVAFIFLVVAVSVKKHKFSAKALAIFALFLVIIFIVGLFTPSFFSELTQFGKDVEMIVENDENAEAAGTYRWGLWVNTARYIKEKPFIGFGFEGTAERLLEDTSQDKAHNEYLENMAYYGIPAGLIYIAGLVSIYIKALKRRKYVDNATLCCLAGALGYIGSAFVGNSFIFIAPFFFIFLGLANNTVPEEKELPKEEPAEESEQIEINY